MKMYHLAVRQKVCSQAEQNLTQLIIVLSLHNPKKRWRWECLIERPKAHISHGHYACSGAGNVTLQAFEPPYLPHLTANSHQVINLNAVYHLYIWSLAGSWLQSFLWAVQFSTRLGPLGVVCVTICYHVCYLSERCPGTYSSQHDDIITSNTRHSSW